MILDTLKCRFSITFLSKWHTNDNKQGWRHRGSAATLGLLSGMFGIQCLVCLITKLCKIYPDIYNLKIIPSIIFLLYFHYSKYIIISTSNCPFSYDLIIEPSYLSTILLYYPDHSHDYPYHPFTYDMSINLVYTAII